MTLVARKRMVIGFIVTSLIVPYIFSIAHWLSWIGVVGWAQSVRNEFLIGTAIAVNAVLLFLIAGSGRSRLRSPTQRCRVCDEPLTRRGQYRSACGSRV